MKKYDFSLSIVTPGNNANHTARVTYFGIASEKMIDAEFDEFSGDTINEVIDKAKKAILDWLSKHEE